MQQSNKRVNKHIVVEKIDISGDKKLFKQMSVDVGKKVSTVPQVIIDGKYIGGYTDTERFIKYDCFVINGYKYEKIEMETMILNNEEPSADKELLLSKGITIFMGDVTETTMIPLVEWILAANLSNKPQKELTLGICSPGGDLNACFALIDVMKGSRNKNN